MTVQDEQLSAHPGTRPSCNRPVAMRSVPQRNGERRGGRTNDTTAPALDERTVASIAAASSGPYVRTAVSPCSSLALTGGGSCVDMELVRVEATQLVRCAPWPSSSSRSTRPTRARSLETRSSWLYPRDGAAAQPQPFIPGNTTRARMYRLLSGLLAHLTRKEEVSLHTELAVYSC